MSRAPIAALSPVLIALAGGPARAAPDDAKHVQPAASATVDDVQVGPLRLPYTIDDGWIVEGEVAIVDVSLDGRRDDVVVKPFQAAAIEGEQLALTIDRAALRLPGDYAVKLCFRPRAAAAAPAAPAAVDAGVVDAGTPEDAAPPAIAADAAARAACEYHTVTIKLAKPTLDALAPVTIRRTSWCFDALPGCDQTTSPLRLSEDSGRLKLSNVTVTPVGAVTPGDANVVVKGALFVDGKPAPHLPPRKQGDLRVTVQGDLALGASTGQIAVHADELDTRKTVAVSIERRMWAGWVFILFALGGALGWLVRTLLAGAIEADERERLAEAQRGALRKLAVRSRTKERVAAEGALATLGPAAAKDAIDKAAAVATEIAAAHTTQLAAVRDALAVRARAAQPSTLATAIGVDAAASALHVDAIERALYDLDVARADFGLKQLDALFEERRPPYQAFVTSARAALAALRNATRRYPATLHLWDGVDPVAPKRSTETDDDAALIAPTIVAQRAAIETLLERSDQATIIAVELGVAAQQTLARDLDTARAIVGAVAEARAATGLVPRLEALARTFAAIRAAFDARVAAHLDRPPLDTTARAAEAAFTSGDWVEAFRQLDALYERPQGGVDEVPVGAPDRAPLPARPAAPPAYVPPVIGGPPAAPPTWIQRNAKIARVLQAAFAYVVLPALAVAAYGDTFVGKPGEWIAILATAFVTDFTAQTVIDRATALKKP